MATYNGEDFIEEQLRSILKQLKAEDEIIISDDGSTDKTCEIIKSFDDERINLIFNEKQHGFTHNFENALMNACGEYIFLSDQDDIWFDNKVEDTMILFENADLIISDCKTINNNLEIVQNSRFAEFEVKPGFFRHFLKSRYLGCCMAFKRSVAEAALPFPKNDFLVEHDIWLAAVAFLYFNVKQLEEPLIYYRRHDNNASSGGFTKGYSWHVKIQKRIYRFIHLIRISIKVKKIKKKFKVS